jgi:hypothetical protein
MRCGKTWWSQTGHRRQRNYEPRRHSEYVNPYCFPRQQCLREHTSVLRYLHCRSCLLDVQWAISITYVLPSFVLLLLLLLLLLLYWRRNPLWVLACRLICGFMDHTQGHITFGRTPLDEWSARRRDPYLTTYNAYNRQTSIPPAWFEPAIPASDRP